MTELQSDVLPIVRETRAMLLPHFGAIEPVAYKSELASDAVTEIDREVEHFVKSELNKRYPDIAFVGEEFGGDRTRERFWLSDPIDGTALFIRGIPGCTTMLALIDSGHVQFSVIYDFVHDVLYHAEKGKGAFANGEKIQVSLRPKERALLIYEARVRNLKDAERLAELQKAFQTEKQKTSGYEHALVASGKIEGRINFDPWGKDYDYAAGSLLVAEAGGVVANLGASTYDYRNLDYMAVTPALFVALTEGPDALFPIQ